MLPSLPAVVELPSEAVSSRPSRAGRARGRLVRRTVGRMMVDPARLAANVVGMLAVFALALFVPAGTPAWPAGWAFLGLFFGFVVGLSLWLLRNNPDLLAERLSGVGRADQKGWDKVLLALTAVLFFAWLAAMALDAARFRWSQVPVGVHAVGAAILLASSWLFFLTFRENAYLSPAVRIQADRGPTVVSSGPCARSCLGTTRTWRR